MNYQKHYDNLITKAQSRHTLNEYTEIHHIIPRSLNGSDEPENLVTLTAREHFVAHLLLAKIHGGKMIHAAYMMSTRKKFSNRVYEKLRIAFSEKISSDKIRALRISDALKGKPKTEEHKRAYKLARLNGDKWEVSEKRKLQMSLEMKGSGNPMWGKTHSSEARKVISDANKQKIECPYCGKSGGIAIMKRWHFENCKNAPVPKQQKKYPIVECPHCGKTGGGAQMISNHFDNCKKK